MTLRNFKSLYLEEQSQINPSFNANGGGVSTSAPGEEPRIRQTPADCVGLALSGGGIRSATFNLGLMQGLHDLKVLKLVQYLATVSGGGYIGGWWTAWRSRVANAGQEFPANSAGQEVAAVRHLREFSNFLAPRLGFFEVETWNAIVAILSGLVPALATALAVVVLALLGWLGFAFLLWGVSHGWGLLALLAGTLVVQLVFELWWRQEKSSEPSRRCFAGFLAATVVALVVPGWMWPVPLNLGSPVFLTLWFPGWWQGLVLWEHLCSPRIHWWLFNPSIAWLVAAAALIAIRFVLLGVRLRCPAPACAEWLEGLLLAVDRVIGRLVAMAVAWAALAAVWEAGANLRQTWLQITAGTGAAAAGGGFAALRHWLGQKLRPARTGGVIEALKPLLPQVLAYLAVALVGVVTAALMVEFRGVDWSRWGGLAAVAGGVIVAALLLFDPEKVGMHNFYRARIARAYLGASNPDPSPKANRETDERVGDDMPLAETTVTRPLHLICCAANDLGGDCVAGLGRGARSAVLSRAGVAIGNDWAPAPSLRLSSALTASAAAFNSNMGSVSMSLGPAVAFLMSALNLRLGLWQRHPRCAHQAPRLLPGWRFFKEMFGCTQADGADIHLSDGAHFENLALYELVRRHCRFIIASDCGADPEVAFDDFANAARRIREDFGVEIEIDLDPLKPGPDRLARQHMAVGTIHYDGNTGLDKGLLLYFKPTLTGDEPRDVTQYKTRNADFPHETTGDQFYDEAQWESYHRLGAHAAREALRFLEKRPEPLGEVDAHALFIEARQAWYPAPPDIGQNFTDLTQRCVDLENQLRKAGLSTLTRQVFPELEVIAPAASEPMKPAEMEAGLRFVLQATQLMEDVWFVAHLDTHWNHPINLGWMNYFQRWAAAPLFRLWWPLLSPQFNLRFRRFMERQCDLPLSYEMARHGTLRSTLNRDDLFQTLVWTTWHPDSQQPHEEANAAYWLEVSLCDDTPPEPADIPLPVGMAFVKIEGAKAEWRGDDVVSLPGLWNSGFGTRFVDLMLKDLAARGVTECCVTLGAAQRTDAGSRRERADHIEFYRRLQFSQQQDRLVRKLV